MQAWGLLSSDGKQLQWPRAVNVYDLSSPLFSDYAHKLRSLYLPPGRQIARDNRGRLRYPVGSIFTKTFYYPRGDGANQVRKSEFDANEIRNGIDLNRYRLLETRLLVHYPQGWKPLVYVWNREQTGARRKITGEIVPLTLVGSQGAEQSFNYTVPDGNQCLSCHATAFHSRQAMPIGTARPDSINRPSPVHGQNQLAYWRQRGWLPAQPKDWPRAPDWRNERKTVQERARAYLDINCAHCHSATGAADTSGLWLNREVEDLARLGACKPPVAAGRGTGGHRWALHPGEPDDSILVHRMASRDPAVMMPELGRDLVHQEGLALIREWVSGLPGHCGGK